MSFICLKCIGDESLRKIARKESTKSKCDYCRDHRLCISMKDLAEIVDEPLRRFCCIGEDTPVFYGESDKPTYEQEGESLDFILQEELEIDHNAAKDLAAMLAHLDPALIQDGDYPFFSDEYNYHRKNISSWRLAESWHEFSSRIKHRRRFFDELSFELLADILGASGSSIAAELPVLEIGPGTRVESVFRARRADSRKEAYTFHENPPKELGPPPPEKATAGRMNSAGISVFYGGLSEDTAIAEVRPFVGSLVVVGEFKLQKILKILDLTRIGIVFTGSIFADDYESRAERRRFLEGFHALIAKPIQPHEEQLEYIPTQAVAEYVSNVLGFDGVLYGSAQLGVVPEDKEEPSLFVYVHEMSDDELKKHNVVLFGDAGIVGDNNVELSADANAAPSLMYVPNSAQYAKISQVNYSHERVYIFGPSESEPEPPIPVVDIF